DLGAIVAEHGIALGSRRNRVEKMGGSGERCQQFRIARLPGKAADLIALAANALDIGGVAGGAGNAPAFSRKPPPQRLGREAESEAEQAIHAPPPPNQAQAATTPTPPWRARAARRRKDAARPAGRDSHRLNCRRRSAH